jgi:hypothetical protein
MAGTIIADFIRTDANKLSLNVGNTTFATINASGFFSNTGSQLIAANGTLPGLTTANLTGTISTSQVADSAITRAKMGFALANTRNTQAIVSISTGTPTAIASVTITTTGKPVILSGNMDFNPNEDVTWHWYAFYRDGSQVGGAYINDASNGASANVPVALSYLDTPAAGTYTYSIRCWVGAGSGGTFGETSAAQGAQMFAVEIL